MQQSSAFSILWLEDDREFMTQIADMVHKMLSSTEQNRMLEKGDANTLNTAMYLHVNGIDWTTDEITLLNEAGKRKHQLIILDMKIQNRLSGWNIIDKLKRLLKEEVPSIWILTQFSQLRAFYSIEQCAEQFFKKHDLQRLQDALYRRFILPRYQVMDTIEYLTFTDRSGKIVRLEIAKIISIESRQGKHVVYMCNEKGQLANKQFPSKDNFLVEVLNQIYQKRISHLIQISRWAVINLQYLEDTRGDRRKYEIKLFQRTDGDTNWLRVTETYLDPFLDRTT